jgi:hypothetical protein
MESHRGPIPGQILGARADRSRSKQGSRPRCRRGRTGPIIGEIEAGSQIETGSQIDEAARAGKVGPGRTDPWRAEAADGGDRASEGRQPMVGSGGTDSCGEK